MMKLNIGTDARDLPLETAVLAGHPLLTWHGTEVVHHLARLGSSSVSTLAEASGLSKNDVSDCLTELEVCRIVRQDTCAGADDGSVPTTFQADAAEVQNVFDELAKSLGHPDQGE